MSRHTTGKAAMTTIAIDGPAAAGKGTLSRLIAGAYGWPPAEILTLSARHRSRLADLIARDRRAGGGRRR